MAAKSSTGRVRLKPEDPFDLIRLLARSQPDPRKAVAELVQNSLDAGARRIEIRWFNEHGRRALRIWDDGEGVFPALGRREALERIAKTIGHSHKRHLSPAERREQMVLGKYGIGLIGFWSLGRRMEIKSRVGNGEVWSLALEEEKSHGEVYRPRARRTDEEATFTEITIREIHDAATRAVRPARLQAYLASELRGQLLEREAEVRIHDRVSRGRAQKEFRVQPQPYLGVPLSGYETLAVPGFEEARLELYLVSFEEERSGRVALACGGSTVLDDVALVDGFEMPRPPWSSGRLEGVIDFPDLEVAPGSRRGFAPNAASQAFLATLEGLERALEVELARAEERLAEQRQRNMAREIRRAFLSVAVRLPEYDLFDVRAGGRSEEPTRNGNAGGAAVGEPPPPGPHPGEGAAAVAEGEPGAGSESIAPAGPDEAEGGAGAHEWLFPPGPLERVRVSPSRLRVAPGTLRTLRARALDRDGRPVEGEVHWRWSLHGQGEVRAGGESCTYAAPSAEAEARIHVTAAHEGRSAEAEVHVAVLAQLAGREKVGGIPEPRAVHAPAEPWRSRMRGEAWEFNSGHRDYQAVADVEARRLRYLIHLFAKEVVLRNFGGDEASLERMVEVLTHLGSSRGA